MKKIIILLLIVLINLSPAYAAKWYKVTDKYYVDLNSPQRYYDPLLYNSISYTFWNKALNNKYAEFINIEKRYNKKVWYKLEKTIINCTTSSYAIKSSIYYDLKNKVIYSQENSNYMLMWNSIPPDTIISWHYDWICKNR